MPDITSSEFDTDLVVRRLGRPRNEGPTLFLLHGLTGSGAAWPGAVTRWGDRYTMVAVDARGHGESPRFTREQLEAHPGEVMVEDAIHLLGQIGVPPVVVGHSLGGAVALAVAAQRPDLVRAVVLEDPAPLSPGQEQRDPARGEEHLDGIRGSRDASDDEELARLRREQHPTWAEDELLASGRGEQQVDTDYLAHGDLMPGTPWPQLFKALMVPALVVTGDTDQDICVDSDMEQGIAEVANPNVRVVRIEGAGHCVRREQPDQFYAAVDEWLVAH